MAEVSVATRLQESGAHALELENVGRHFGALVALDGITMRIAASERRAVIGSNGAGKTTLFNAITGDFLPTSGSIRFFNEDITTLSGTRTDPARTAPDLPDFPALRRSERPRFASSRLLRRFARAFFLVAPAHRRPTMMQAESILHAVHLESIRERLVATLSHGQQRQLEIALALAGAPRFILFDEPAAGFRRPSGEISSPS